MSNNDIHGGPKDYDAFPEGVRIVDKREERRIAAQQAKEQAEQQPPLTVVSAGEEEESVDLANLRYRIEALRQKQSLSPEEQQELLSLQAQEQEAIDAGNVEVTNAVTAFLVIIGHDGSARADANVNLVMALDREANYNDLTTGCALVARDVQASDAAQQVVFGLGVSAQAMAQQKQAAQMMAGHMPPGMRRR